MEGIFLEEQCVPHAGSRPGKGAVAAHGHGIAVRRNATVGEPVGRVAQLAGVDDVFFAGAAPHPVVALGHKIKVGDFPLHLHRALHGVHGHLAAINAGPLGGGAVLGKFPVEMRPAGRCFHPQPALLHLVDDAVPVQFLKLAALLCGGALHRHGIPGPEPFPDALRRDAAVVQRDGRPVARHRAVDFQRAVAAPRAADVLHFQEQCSVRRVFRLGPAIFLRFIGPALGVAGGKLHLFPAPRGPQRLEGPLCRVKGCFVREDQNFCPDPHQRFFAVRHGVFQRHRRNTRFVGRVDQIFSADGQQPVEVIHPVQVFHLSQLPAGRPGAQGREIPGRKIDARAVLRLRAGVGLVQPAKGPQEGTAVLDAASVCQCHRYCPSFHQRHRAPARGGYRCLSQTASSAASALYWDCSPA